MGARAVTREGYAGLALSHASVHACIMSSRHLRVKRHSFDWQEATYAFDALQDPQWSQISGGIKRTFPREMICAYVACNEALAGEVAHSGSHGECPHWIKVCVTKKGSSPQAFAELKRLADEHRRSRLLRTTRLT
jgi:hypothetical protein